MKPKQQKILLSLRFIPFVITNGMNLFPILILAQVYLVSQKVAEYVLPLIMYFSFKMTILFLVKLIPMKINKLLQTSIIVGAIGCFLGIFFETNLFCIILSGALLGICSGTLYPSFLTVQFHEKTYNNFSNNKKEQILSIIFAFVFSGLLFVFLKWSISTAFIFLGGSLISLLLVLSVFPRYELIEDVEKPKYSVFETMFFFITGFLAIFVLKVERKLGIANLFPVFFVILLVLLIIYFCFVIEKKPERRINPYATTITIYKGMITNFILVFCTFYQLLIEGGVAIYKIYIIYLIAITLAPPIYTFLLKKFLDDKIISITFLGIFIGFSLLIWPMSFYIGVLILSFFCSLLNLKLNSYTYYYVNLPKDRRILAKYRLTNIGSILHQLVMMMVVYLVTLFIKHVSINDLLNSYSEKNVNPAAFFTLEVCKNVLIFIFLVILGYLANHYKKRDNTRGLL